MSTDQATPAPATFEGDLATLETLVEAMESGDMPLEKLVLRYSEGVALLKRCEAHLAAAELRIEELQPSDGDAG